MKTQAELLKISRTLPNNLLSELLDIVDTKQYVNTHWAKDLEKMHLIVFIPKIKGAMLTKKGWRWFFKIANANAELMYMSLTHPNTKNMYRKESYIHWTQRWYAYATKAEMHL